MNFEFSDEQQMLREQARGFLTEHCPSSVVRAVLDGDSDWDAALWARVAEMGWTATVIPEAFGGLGLSYYELAIIEVGKILQILTTRKLTSEEMRAYDAPFPTPDYYAGPRMMPEIVAADLKATLELEQAMLESSEIVVPDALGTTQRVAALAAKAKNARMGARATRVRRLIDRSKAEAAAQEALLESREEDFTDMPMSRRLFLKRYGETRTGRFARERLWE